MQTLKTELPIHDPKVEDGLVEWFQDRGDSTTLQLEEARAFPADFAEYAKESGFLEDSLCPVVNKWGAGWTPRRAAACSGAMASYGFTEWLMWHVSSLSALPVWMSSNIALQKEYRAGFAGGQFGAFGMSEKSTGADWRDTKTWVERIGDRYYAHGGKDYTGNGNISPLITTFARLREEGRDSFILCRVDSRRRGYILDRNAVSAQMHVSQFRLDGYSFDDNDVITFGDQAFNDAVNTLNVGKFNLATAGVGMAKRALAETYFHTSGKRLFGVTALDFGQVRRILNEASLRIVAADAFNMHTVSTFELASPTNDAYRVYASVAKSKVTYEMTAVIRELGEAISAKAFESGSMFRVMAQYVEWLPRLEGTRYVNMMQSIKAAPGFFAAVMDPSPFPAGERDSAAGSAYLLSRRPLGGIADTQFNLSPVLRHTEQSRDTALLVEQIVALAPLYESIPRSRGNENVVAALSELFTHSLYSMTALSQLLSEGFDPDRLAELGRLLHDDLVVHILRARSTVDIPPQALRAAAGRLSKTPLVDAGVSSLILQIAAPFDFASGRVR